MAKKILRLKKLPRERVATAFEGIVHGVALGFHNMHAEMDSFDEELEGSAITDEIRAELDKHEKKINAFLEDRRKYLLRFVK